MRLWQRVLLKAYPCAIGNCVRKQSVGDLPVRTEHLISGLLLAVAAAVLSGCAQTPVYSELANPASAEPVLCVGKVQCDVYWQRAQAWVANNSEYRLQTI